MAPSGSGSASSPSTSWRSRWGRNPAIVVISLLGPVLSATQLWHFRAHAATWRRVRSLLAAAVLGALVGTQLLVFLPGPVISLALGLFTIWYVVTRLRAERPALASRTRASTGAAGGLRGRCVKRFAGGLRADPGHVPDGHRPAGRRVRLRHLADLLRRRPASQRPLAGERVLHERPGGDRAGVAGADLPGPAGRLLVARPACPPTASSRRSWPFLLLASVDLLARGVQGLLEAGT